MDAFTYRAVVTTDAPSLVEATRKIEAGEHTLASPVRYVRDRHRAPIETVTVAPGQSSGLRRVEPYERVTENAYEVAVIDHLRGNCHDSKACAICCTENALFIERTRINEIIGG